MQEALVARIITASVADVLHVLPVANEHRKYHLHPAQPLARGSSSHSELSSALHSSIRIGIVCFQHGMAFDKLEN